MTFDDFFTPHYLWLFNFPPFECQGDIVRCHMCIIKLIKISQKSTIFLCRSKLPVRMNDKKRKVLSFFSHQEFISIDILWLKGIKWWCHVNDDSVILYLNVEEKGSIGTDRQNQKLDEAYEIYLKQNITTWSIQIRLRFYF